MKFLVCLLIFLSCEKEEDNKSRVLFEHYYINYAWVYTYDHWIIDKYGHVWLDKDPDKKSWTYPHNYFKDFWEFDTLVYTISSSELDYYVSLIPGADKGEITCETNQWRDFGYSAFFCIIDDHSVLLQSLSDGENCQNHSPEAIILSDWLSEINSRIH